MYKNRLKDKLIFFPKFFDFSLNFYFKYTSNDTIEDRIIDCIGEANNILDIYCKTGTMTIKVAKNNQAVKIIGMENNNNYLIFARRQIRYSFLKNISFINLSNIEFYKEYFDCVLLYFALNDLSSEGVNELLEYIKKVLINRKKLIIVDYHYVKKGVKGYLYNIYIRLFKRQRLKFIKYDLINTLSKIGYHDIS